MKPFTTPRNKEFIVDVYSSESAVCSVTLSTAFIECAKVF